MFALFYVQKIKTHDMLMLILLLLKCEQKTESQPDKKCLRKDFIEFN